jgi:hypothetical protein
VFSGCKKPIDYAEKNGLQGFVAVSNNFSLARMVNPVWGGCISASDKASREWFEQTQIALMPWSSQARGFFVRGDKNFTADEELTRCWYSTTISASGTCPRNGEKEELATHRTGAGLRVESAIPDLPAHRPAHSGRDSFVAVGTEN